MKKKKLTKKKVRKSYPNENGSRWLAAKIEKKTCRLISHSEDNNNNL